MRVVDTEDGPITLVSLDFLRQVSNETLGRLNALAVQIDALQKQVVQLRGMAGQLLTEHPADWVAGDRAARIDAARALGQLATSLEKDLADVHARPHRGIGGLIQGVKDGREAKSLEEKLQSARAELANRYSAVAYQLDKPTGIKDADSLLEQVREAEARKEELEQRRQATSREHGRMSEEIKRRADVASDLGFDALGIQADLDANGLRPVATSLVLKKNEVAAVDVPASLCRVKTKTQFVGGSHGISIPLGHGFRYRVSSFRGHPVQSEYLAQIDVGNLVVTNQRLVFLGSHKDVATPIGEVLEVEKYSNAIGVAREGKEARDIYEVAKPEYVLIYLNWVVGHQG